MKRTHKTYGMKTISKQKSSCKHGNSARNKCKSSSMALNPLKPRGYTISERKQLKEFEQKVMTK